MIVYSLNGHSKSFIKYERKHRKERGSPACPLRTRIIPDACLFACVRALRAIHACVHACANAAFVRVCMCAYSPLLSPSRFYALDSTVHAPPSERASERESAINAWHCHWSSWQRNAPRTTSERSASIVRKCVLRARARTHACTHATRTHARTHARTRAHDLTYTLAHRRPPATRLAKDRVQRTIDGPQTSRWYYEYMTHTMTSLHDCALNVWNLLSIPSYVIII